MNDTPLDGRCTEALTRRDQLSTRVALESRCPRRLLSGMTEAGASETSERSLLDEALATGSLATIATGGALIGLGMREGETSRVFRLAGRGLLERLGTGTSAPPLTSVGVGYVHHLIVASLWGVLLALLVLPLNGIKRVVAAIVAAAAYAWISVGFVPAALRIGYSVTSNVASAVPIGVALAMALLGGVWLAATETRA